MRRRPVVQHLQTADPHTLRQPKPVSDRRLAALDLTALALATVMALGPLTAYAVVGA